MRVITGSARGRALKTLEGDDVRPTTDRVKEGVFSAIQFDIEGRKVLDLFAGSGQLGIEALSRGAEAAVFVDTQKNSAAVVKENLAKTGFTEKSSVFQTDAFSFLRMTDKVFDIVFLDPPYSTGLLQKALTALNGHVSAGGIVVCEAPYGEELPEQDGNLIKQKTYKYGKISITIYRNQ